MPGAIEVEIVDYSADYGDAFERLNSEWLDKYFRIEPIDREVLSNPQTSIIDHGGVILYQVTRGEAVGTVALKHHGRGIFELTKMAVTSTHQGKGYGQQLLSAAIARFLDLEGDLLYLESHSSLTVALALYESAGFRHQPRPRPSDYERSDVYMVYHGNQAS